MATLPLVDLCTLCSSGRALLLNVVFSFNLFEVFMVMNDSKDLLVVSLGDITYRMEYRWFHNRFQNRRLIPVQRYTGGLCRGLVVTADPGLHGSVHNSSRSHTRHTNTNIDSGMTYSDIESGTT